MRKHNRAGAFETSLLGLAYFVSLASLVCIVAFTCCLPVLAQKGRWALDSFEVGPGPAFKHERVLSFPKDYSLGEILLTDWPKTKASKELRGAARGTVVVPANTLSKLVPAYHYYTNLNLVDTLPADGFDSILLAASSMADSEDGLCDKALARVGHLKGLVELDLDRSDATDLGVAHADELPNLQKITAFSAAIEGNCFKHFSSLKQLRFLRMPRNPVKDDNLEYLASVPELRFLSLSHCNLSDAGVKHLAKCTKLYSLNLADNPRITDQSIKYFLTMKQLRFLHVAGTSISVKGILQLKPLSGLAIDIPPRKCTVAEYNQLRQAFPNLPPLRAVRERHTIDADTREIFAPLH